MKQQEPQIILCPYCGHVQTVPVNAAVPDQCDECNGLFEPLSRRATQISMGPWYIRDKKNPFRPGCSFEVVSKMARNNRIKPTTVMRGPSTKQFWSVARNVPGIAHLLGYCHQCSAKVEPTAAACQACNAKFEEPKERNELGLAYRTAQEAAAAQRALEKEIAAITGAPVSPGGSGISPAISAGPATPGSGLLDEVLGGGGKFGGGSPLLNFGSQPAVAAGAAAAGSATAFAPIPQPARAAGAGGPAPQGAQPSFAGGFRPAQTGSPVAAGRAVDAFSLGGEADDTGIDDVARKQRSASLMTWGLIGFNAVLVIVVIAFVLLNNKGKPAESKDGSNPTKDAGPDAPSGSTTPRNSSLTSTTKTKPAFTTEPDPEPAPVATPAVPTIKIDPSLDRDAMNAKLEQARALVDANDLKSALPLLKTVQDKYPEAWHPPDLKQRIGEIEAELARLAGESKDKVMAEEVTALLATAKIKQNKNDYPGTLAILAEVRDNYPAKFHPKDLALRMADLVKAIETKGKAKFFGQDAD
jgi:hypothetical protein